MHNSYNQEANYFQQKGIFLKSMLKNNVFYKFKFSTLEINFIVI